MVITVVPSSLFEIANLIDLDLTDNLDKTNKTNKIIILPLVKAQNTIPYMLLFSNHPVALVCVCLVS